MTRLSAGTLAGPLQGKRTSIPDRVPRQTRSSGEGLQFQCLQLSHEGHWRPWLARLAVQSQPTRSLGQILPSGSRPPPGPLPLPSRRGPRWCQWVCQSISGLDHFPPALPLCPPLLTSPGIVPTAHCSPTCSPHSSFKRYLCPDRRLRLLPTTPAFSVASL